MFTPDLSRAVWRKSSRSGANGGDCVEVAQASGWAAVRDSKDRSGPVLAFGLAEWDAFRLAIKDGQLD